MISRWFDSLDRKDIAEIADIRADDITVEFPFSETGKTEEGSFRVYSGKDEVVPFWESTLEVEGTMHSFKISDGMVHGYSLGCGLT